MSWIMNGVMFPVYRRTFLSAASRVRFVTAWWWYL